MTGFTGKLPRKSSVRELVTKSIESAVLAVEVYNKPTVQFRTGAYASLMIVAWTAALHAVFERDGISYFYKRKNGRFEKIDGDRRAWELLECCKNYTGPKLTDSIRANLKLFVRLRNKIEHRHMRTLDSHIWAESQALLLNLKSILKAEFDVELLNDFGIYVPISTFDGERLLPQSLEERAVVAFVDQYRQSLDAETWNGVEYAFRAFLMPRIGNHENSSDVTIEFIKLDGLSDEQKQKITRLATMVRDRQTTMRGDLLKPKGVVDQIKLTHPHFTMTKFVNAWKALDIRPTKGSDDPGSTDTKYCHFDPVDKDYRYEPRLVKRIADLLNDGVDFDNPDQAIP